LKSFYDQIVAAESEQVVLQRTPAVVPEPAATPKTSTKGKKKR